MKKILSIICLLIITACTSWQTTQDTFVENAQHEKIYLKVEGLENAKYHKLVFLQHGLASHMDHQAIQAAKRAFLQHNYVVILFDSRHSLGNSDNDVEKVSLTGFENDLRTITSWAKTQPFYSEPFALVGHSLGGASVLQYSAAHPEKVNILIPITPVISGQKWKRSCMQNLTAFCHQWKNNGSYQYTDEQKHKTAIIPYQIVTDSMNYNADMLASHITADTLLIAAQNDIIIGVDDVQNLAQEIQRGQIIVIPNSGHNFNDINNQSDLYHAINSFLR